MMKRRGFFERVFGIGMAAVVAPSVLAESKTQPGEIVQKADVFESNYGLNRFYFCTAPSTELGFDWQSRGWRE